MEQIQENCCPVCRCTDFFEFRKETILPEKLSAQTFASRKAPELMSYHLVRCRQCGLIYAQSHPAPEHLLRSYRVASFDSGREADDAARTYAGCIRMHLPGRKRLAVDVGSGNGALLVLLKEMGFGKVTGFEPSAAAFQNSSAFVRENMVNSVFDERSIPDESADLIVICMTLEHVHDPGSLVGCAFRKLAPGGRLFLADHDYQALCNRIMGMHSPIIDIEHLQLFNREALSVLLENNGFQVAANAPYWNRYRLDYLLRLLPAGESGRNILRKIFSFALNVRLPLPLGNRFAVGVKPEVRKEAVHA